MRSTASLAVIALGIASCAVLGLVGVGAHAGPGPPDAAAVGGRWPRPTGAPCGW